MSLHDKKINPLNVLGLRTLTICPPNFYKTYVSEWYDIQKIEEWIYKRLNSRYCVRKIQKIDNKNKLVNVYEIGFEDPTETTMFSLACPFLKT